MSWGRIIARIDDVSIAHGTALRKAMSALLVAPGGLKMCEFGLALLSCGFHMVSW